MLVERGHFLPNQQGVDVFGGQQHDQKVVHRGWSTWRPTVAHDAQDMGLSSMGHEEEIQDLYGLEL